MNRCCDAIAHKTSPGILPDATDSASDDEAPRTTMEHHASFLEGMKTAKAIREELQQIGARARARYPVLAHQDALGLTIFFVACAGIVGNAIAYAKGVIPAAAAVVIAALLMSILHEIEHDLIHHLYFKNKPAIHRLMMAGVWLFRPNTINPWTRRHLHLHHHRASGTESDLEERGITNGERWGLRRALMTADGMLAIYLRPLTMARAIHAYIAERGATTRVERRRLIWQNRLSYVPLGLVHYPVWHAFLLYHAWMWVAPALGISFAPSAFVQTIMTSVDFLVIVWLMPNVLRSFCLNFVSSNIHYYGDVEDGSVVQQTQVWTSPWLFPFELFCFNFGSTHAIHHFVVRDPFYVRQLIAREAHQVLREHGVRFNDMGTFSRANRWADHS